MPFDPDQPRDEIGRWTDTGASAETSTIKDAGNAIRRAASDQKRVKLNFTPNPDLSPEQQKIEIAFINDLEENFYQREHEYLTNKNLSGERGNIVSNDAAKELSPDYRNNRSELAPAVHEPASAFVKKVYERLLERKPETNLVAFTAGGTGAGKTTALAGKGLEKIKEIADKADIVYDSNLSNFKSAKGKIDDAIKSGRDVSVIFVHREVEDAFKEGVIPRMKNTERTVPITEHVQRTAEAFPTLEELHKHYSGNSKVEFRLIDNSFGRGNARESTFAELKKKAYIANTKEIQDRLTNYVKQLRQQGQITERQFKGLTTKTGREGSVSG